MRRAVSAIMAAVGAALAAPATAAFTTFESGQVRPLALSPSGDRLYAVNTPDNRLEIFAVGPGGLTHLDAVPVGLEPVAVAARTAGEVWVVNHLSDSVSVVDVAASPPRVVRTLLVGDEPRDIVFAGPGASRAFVTTARRGQNLPSSVPPLLTTPGTPRALVFVFDAANPGLSLGGDPLTVVELFGDTPRALAASADGSRVYAAVFHSGNQTTALNEGAVCNDSVVDGVPSGPCVVDGGIAPGGLPPPETNVDGVLRPETGLIVQLNRDSGKWEDELGRDWSVAVRFDLPDQDVFAIDAAADPPAQLAGPAGAVAHVGTVLFNMVVDPANPSRIYVSNTEASNQVRFEGPGIFGGSSVRGHLHEARVTVVDGGAVLPRHLNKHLNYTVVPSPPGDAAKSLATPTGMALTADGTTLYVAAFGSSAVGVFDTAQLLDDTFTPSAGSHIAVTGGGPSGLVLDEPNDRLYVLTRFDNGISVIDTVAGAQVAHLTLPNPEPASVVAGRPFLYDAAYTSSNGEASCASCHVFGDLDSLAWDLGDPDASVLENANPFRVADPLGTAFPDHHPMKGPMTTQSLRGMANQGPMHWRGDRSGALDEPNLPPDGGAFDEDLAFKKFNVAFAGLLGRGAPLTPGEMQAFTDFILQVTYPPNPIRNLDDSLTGPQVAGQSFFFDPQPSDVFENCNGCHRINPAAGFFGGDGRSSFEFEPQLFKIPHFRNLYQKVGMFGMMAVPFFNPGDNGHTGDQIRGFGFLHDGSTDTLFRFHHSAVFNQTNPGGIPVPNPGGFPAGAEGDLLRRQVEAFLLAADTNLKPIVGQQVTLSAANAASVDRAVTAKKLLIKKSGAPLAPHRQVVAISKDPALAAPLPGSAGDPRCVGLEGSFTPSGSITVRSTTSGQVHSEPLYCGNWSLLGSPASPKGYVYRSDFTGAAKKIVWKSGRLLKVLLTDATGLPVDFDLQNGTSQGLVELQLSSRGDSTCVQCGPVDDARDGRDGRKYLALGATCVAPTRCIADGVDARLGLLVQLADLGHCDLVAKGTAAGEARGWRYRPSSDDFQSDRAAEPALTAAQLRAVATAPGQAVTFTCTPPGSGLRIGIDRDEDGALDRDEIDAGSDPADPGSTP